MLLVPGDTPLLAADELEALLARADAEQLGIVVVPDRHGEGTNALLLQPPDAIAPSFGPGSRERHVESARASGRAHAVEPLSSLMLDIDTGVTDALLLVLESIPGQAPQPAARAPDPSRRRSHGRRGRAAVRALARSPRAPGDDLGPYRRAAPAEPACGDVPWCAEAVQGRGAPTQPAEIEPGDRARDLAL